MANKRKAPKFTHCKVVFTTHPSAPWRVSYPVEIDGITRRKRRMFSTEQKAMDFAADHEKDVSDFGVRFGAITGENAAQLRARLQSIDRSQSIYQFWGDADAVAAAVLGDRAEANRRAAIVDAQPAGPFLLAVLGADCLCGAPFDLDATPNFKARLAESGLRWPPPPAIRYPATARTASP